MKKSSLNTITKDLKFVYSKNKSISIVFQDNLTLSGVVGELNSNLKDVASRSGVIDSIKSNFSPNLNSMNINFALKL